MFSFCLFDFLFLPLHTGNCSGIHSNSAKVKKSNKKRKEKHNEHVKYKGTQNPYVILAEHIGIRLIELLDCRSKSYKSLRKPTYLLQMYIISAKQTSLPLKSTRILIIINLKVIFYDKQRM